MLQECCGGAAVDAEVKCLMDWKRAQVYNSNPGEKGNAFQNYRKLQEYYSSPPVLGNWVQIL